MRAKRVAMRACSGSTQNAERHGGPLAYSSWNMTASCNR